MILPFFFLVSLSNFLSFCSCCQGSFVTLGFRFLLSRGSPAINLWVKLMKNNGVRSTYSRHTFLNFFFPGHSQRERGIKKKNRVRCFCSQSNGMSFLEVTCHLIDEKIHCLLHTIYVLFLPCYVHIYGEKRREKE